METSRRWLIALSLLGLFAACGSSSTLKPSDGAARSGGGQGGSGGHAGSANDGGGGAGGSNPDHSSRTSVGDDYSQWWDPTCKTQAGGCDASKCRPAQLTVWQTKCGASMTIMAGCIRSDGGTNGWGCYIRPVDGRIIQTMDFPQSLDGLRTCIDAGLTNDTGYFYAQCGDGGAG